MLEFEKYTLDNGLTVILHQDRSTPFAVCNLLYKVGSKNENPEHTGLAHLFEHLMFGGSLNAPDFDEALQQASGENNAFTNVDITNYYETVPASNIETCLWLESDRMLQLNLGDKSIDTQRKVVCEEFKEHYINPPYGDVWHRLMDLSYTTHPYKIPTIGKELSHIEQASTDTIRDFYKHHYAPNNAILCIGGDIDFTDIKHKIQKWFADIPAATISQTPIAAEPTQAQKRSVHHIADVPVRTIYKSWHVCDRLDPAYQAMDIITDILGYGNASRLYRELIKEKNVFSEIDCYHTGTIDAGLLIIEGKLHDGIQYEEAEKEIDATIQNFLEKGLYEKELQRCINKTETQFAFQHISLLNRCMDLAFYEMLGDASWVNDEKDKYIKLSEENIHQYAQKIFTDSNSNVLYYGK